MTGVFLKVVDMSAMASVVIAVILLLRLALRRAPKKWSYLLWSAAAFRLCCPVSLPSAVSLFRFSPIRPTVTGSAGLSGVSYLPPAVSQAAIPAATAQAQAAAVTAPSAAASAAPAAQAAAVSAPTWLTAAAVLWCAGMAALLFYSVVTYGRMRSAVSDAVRLQGNVYEADRIRSPFILGLLRPHIYIPLGLEGERLDYVLAHERCHLRRGDNIVKVFAFLLLTVHWFNPLCWLAFALMGRDMEMSCDEKVLSEGGNIRKAYSTTLLSFASPDRFPAAGPLAFGETGVRARIRNALNWRRPKAWVTLTAAILCVACIAACAANPKGAKSGEIEPPAAQTGQTEQGTPEPKQEQSEPVQTPNKEFDLDAALASALADIEDGTVPVQLALAEAFPLDHRPFRYSGRGTPNAVGFSRSLENYAFEAADVEIDADGAVILSCPDKGWSFRFRQGEHLAVFFPAEEGAGYPVRAEYLYGEEWESVDYSIGTLMRGWYDEAEYADLGGFRGTATIADRGQSSGEAAQECCEFIESVHLLPRDGSAYKYSWLKCAVHIDEEQTESLRSLGEIDENTWCFTMAEMFLPENDRALGNSIAGNTMGYAQYLEESGEAPEAGVPEGAQICWRVGYVKKTADGWQVDGLGTGW